MKKWVLKAIVQKLISFLPFRFKINYFFQKYITKGIRLNDAYFEDKLIHFKEHKDLLTRYKSHSRNLHLLEIGSGWHPVIPLSFYLSGYNNIYTIDINQHYSDERLKETIEQFIKWYESNRLQEFVEVVPDRMERLIEMLTERLEPFKALSTLGIEYRIGYLQGLTTWSNRFEYIFSNNVLEHVKKEQLVLLLKAIQEKLKPDCITHHYIDMSDHFAHYDKSIGILHFLQFKESEWKWINNSIQPMNRLRLYSYLELFLQANYDLIYEDHRKIQAEELQKYELALPFSGMPEDELVVTHSSLLFRI